MRNSSARFLPSNRLIVGPLFSAAVVILFIQLPEAVAQSRNRSSARTPARRTQPAKPEVDAYAPEPGYAAPANEPSTSSIDSTGGLRESRRTPDNIWQAHAGRFAATSELGYGLNRPDLKLNGGKIGELNQSRFTFNFGGEYGVTRNIAVRVRTSYGNSSIETKYTIPSTNTTYKASGLGDVELGGKVLYPIQSFLVSADLGLGISFGNAKAAESGQEGNRYSGGLSLNPTIGGAAYLGRAGFLGALLGYRFKFERSETAVSGQTAKLTGGNQLIPQIFYEFQHQNFFLAPSLSYIVTDDLKRTLNGPQATFVYDSIFAMALKGGIYINPDLRLAAIYTLSSMPETSLGSQTTGSHYDHDFLFSARMQF